MKKILIIATIAVLSSCQFLGFTREVGNGVSVDTVIEAEAFDAISLTCSLDVIYSQTTDESSVTLTCDENLVPFYVITVKDGTLIISTKSKVSLSPRVKTYVTVHSPSLSSIKVSGSGDCKVVTPLKTRGELDFKVTGSGDIDVNGTIQCRDFSATVTGSGDIEIGGLLADTADYKVTGSGEIEVNQLTADAISSKITGSGKIDLSCKKAGDISAAITGSGDLYLRGNARSLKKKITGSGSIHSKNLAY